MTTFDTLAEDYDAGRLGYANDVYNALVDYGLAPKHTILDVGCGTGLASGPLIDNDFDVTGIDRSEPMLEIAKRRYPNATWVAGEAEKLPFDAEGFGAVISAQTMHHLDRGAALREIIRVLRPGGIVAIWWKHLMSDDAVKLVRDAAAQELGFAQPPSGLKGGFKEFYAAPFAENSLRVILWRAAMPLSQFLQYERSRQSTRKAFGERVDEYFTTLERRLRERFGSGDPILTLAYTHYVYLAKK